MILFIAGAHAVGKSYLCSNFLINHDVEYHSASSLIAKGKAENWGIDKKTSDAELNQKILIKQLASFKENKEDLLLDGHFVLVSNESKFIQLNHSIFHEMGINGIVLVETDEEKIIRRFTERAANLSFSPKELMALERKNALAVAKRLNIPLVILNSPSIECFNDIIESILL